MFAKLFTVATLAASALATVFVTEPTGASTYTAGQNATVSWIDNGDAPTLAAFGLASIAIYAGNQIQQTLLQTIATNVNVSNVSSVTFQPDATIGPDSSAYFIRFQSASATNPQQPQQPALAFSAMFKLTGMTGTFDASVLAQISGVTSSTSSSAASLSTPAASITSTNSMGTSPSLTSSGSPTPTGTTNGAVSNYASSAVLLASGLLSAYLAL